jgi:hypothetical protein
MQDLFIIQAKVPEKPVNIKLSTRALKNRQNQLNELP